MEITIHTRQVLEERWRLPNSVGPDTSDEELLAMVRGQVPGVMPKRAGIKKTFDIAEPYVFSRGEADLDAVGRQLADARAAVDRAMDAAKEAARTHGATSERQIAAKLGVDRNTVRAWRRSG